MNEIIKITTATINNETINAVNARDLHRELGVKTQFKDWMPRRIDEYGFEEGRDFTVLKNERGRNANGKFCSKEYIISLDMAKELAMVENNAQGRKIRQYFIEVEKQYRNADNVVASLLQLVEHRIMAYAETIARQQSELRFLRAFAPVGTPGEISRETGNPKYRYRRGYYTSGKGKAVTALIERYDQPGLFDEIELHKLN